MFLHFVSIFTILESLSLALRNSIMSCNLRFFFRTPFAIQAHNLLLTILTNEVKFVAPDSYQINSADSMLFDYGMVSRL
jgi:hypothetical protein